MNDKQIKALLRSGVLGRKRISNGLYLRVQTANSASWEYRYTINGKSRAMTLAGGNYPTLSLADAQAQVALLRQQVKQGIDPMAERQRTQQTQIKIVDDLFDDWHLTLVKRLKYPNIPKRIYTSEIKPSIGKLAISRVNARDIRGIIEAVTASGRPAVANDTLMYCKQLFNHACKLDLAPHNPASAFRVGDAGGIEKSRDRALSIAELKAVFAVLHDNLTIFTRQNYLALALLLTLGVRKGELIAAQWQEFDFDKQLWDLPTERSKTGIGMVIPLPKPVIAWLQELKVMSCGSPYLFPSRRLSKRRQYISDDTLNHALAKMFGLKVASNGAQYNNLLGEADIKHFTVHDLRRTCRSLLAELGVNGHVAERCLNHKLKGVEGIYDRHDYLTERREALDKLATVIAPIVNQEPTVIALPNKTIKRA
ncbi:tyrosine-type recombinase/integrase [Ferrimonas senticii]|uniref:tyrosine-type recombinase/integrase n=1 Tax=Ferrimonas senticii TaxID=394566 RepID=UPI00040D8F81|nr:site-specific integrase [Ferrimonas senticii]